MVLLCLGLALYGGALGHPLLFDDSLLIEGNSNFTWSRAGALVSGEYFSLFPEQMVSYRPLSTLSYIVNRSLWGEDYRFWRLGYLLLHVVNAWLVYVLLSRAGSSRVLAWVGGAVFLLHPVHAEVVNQVSFNEEVLMTCCALLAWLAFMGSRGGGGRGLRLVVPLGYWLALLSKETVLFFPVLVGAWVFLERRGEEGWRRVGRGDALLMVSLAVVALWYVVVRFVVLTNPVDARELVVTAAGVREVLALLFDSTGRVFWPSDLAAMYQVRSVGWWSPPVVGGVLLVVAVLGAVGLGVRRRRPELAVPGLWFGTGMAPLVLNLAEHSEALAYDRYLYYPMVGLVWYGIAAAGAVARRVRLSRRAAWAGWGAAAAVLAALGAVTVSRNRVWSSGEALWTDTLRTNPDAPTARYNLGLALLRQGKSEEAAGQLSAALSLARSAEAFTSLGNAYAELGDYRAAAEAYRRALLMKPGDRTARNNLGLAYVELGRYQRAAEQLQPLVEENPELAEALYNLGNAYSGLGRHREAISAYERALLLRPDHAETYNNLGISYDRAGNYQKALESYENALRVTPDYVDARYNLAFLQLTHGDTESAERHHRVLRGLNRDAAARLETFLRYYRR